MKDFLMLRKGPAGSGAAGDDAELKRLSVKPWTFDNMLRGGKIVANRATLYLDEAEKKLKRRSNVDTAVVIYMNIESALYAAVDSFAWFKAAADLATTEPQLRSILDAIMPTIGAVIERFPGMLTTVINIAEAEGAHLQDVLGRTNAWSQLKQWFLDLLPKLPKLPKPPDLGMLAILIGAAVAAAAALGASRR